MCPPWRACMLRWWWHFLQRKAMMIIRVISLCRRTPSLRAWWRRATGSPWCESSTKLVPWEALLHVKNKKKKEQKSKKEKKKNTMTIVKKECGKTKVEKRAQEVLGHQNGHVTVEKRAQEVLGQTTAMRWVEKEQKRKVKMKKTNSAALVLLLLWCLPCLCSAQGALAATNDTSPATGANVWGFKDGIPRTFPRLRFEKRVSPICRAIAQLHVQVRIFQTTMF